MDCARCGNKECYRGKDCTDVTQKVLILYKENPHHLKMASVSAELEGNYYMQLTRLEELISFCRLMDFKQLGIAFCVGLSEEVEKLHKILTKHFKVSSVFCKICGIEKDYFDLTKIEKDRIEVMCNPSGQVTILNNEGTDLNIIFGLCIGHDILFTKQSQAPVTTLVVKDRVLAHNPIGAIYSGYYRKKKFNEK
ncbi:MAG: DUF1847 domain-containing protein [Gemmatimonadota bacterium]|nr:MAG: DUF1847 domain-containing protein [Gemmatimonadota bacterium]